MIANNSIGIDILKDFLDAHRQCDGADARVAVFLYLRAIGYTVSKDVAFKLKDICPTTGKAIERVEIVALREEIPGDVAACGRWLGNRRRKQWAPPQRDVPTGDTAVTVNINEANIRQKQTEGLKEIFGEAVALANTKKPPTSH